jgi:nicotinamide-nucleotide amidase
MEGLGQTPKVAILATGDEILNGEILNTNGPYIAQQCVENNIQPGIQMTVSDNQDEMESAMRYLLQDHRVLITLGGLGPTSDDRTRFALSAALGRPLQFDSASWDRIVEMLTRKSLPVPENNRQQCEFPTGAEIIVNHNGSASACFIQHGEQLIFMLPGPPNECRPLFDNKVLPKLLNANLQEIVFRQSWLLFSVSEGSIAETLDPLIEGSLCEIGYRVSYPYLEVKLQSTDEAAIQALSEHFDTLLATQLVSKTKQSASDLLIEYLQNNKTSFSILDEATYGHLTATLASPKTLNTLIFCDSDTDYRIRLRGLAAYWHSNGAAKETNIHIDISKSSKMVLDKMLTIPIRGARTITYAIERISLEILNLLKGQNLK